VPADAPDRALEVLDRVRRGQGALQRPEDAECDEGEGLVETLVDGRSSPGVVHPELRGQVAEQFPAPGHGARRPGPMQRGADPGPLALREVFEDIDRKSTRLNSSHGSISYAVF